MGEGRGGGEGGGYLGGGVHSERKTGHFIAFSPQFQLVYSTL